MIDSERCPRAVDEFSLYEYEIDKKTGEILTGYPQGQPDHYLALTRYALEEIWRKRGAKQPQAVLQEAEPVKYDDLLRVPYKAHGRDKSGLDCYGLIYVCASRMGYVLPELKDLYDLDNTKAVDFVHNGLSDYLEKIEKQETNCFCLFNFKDVTHTGIYLGGGKLLHATLNHGVVVSPLFSQKPFAFYRLRKQKMQN